MYLILSKEDFETRSKQSKEHEKYPEGELQTIELGSLKVKRLEHIEGRDPWPDKPKGWGDFDVVFLSMTYSDIKTMGGIVMHKEEAAKLGEFLVEACSSNRECNHFIETKTPERAGAD